MAATATTPDTLKAALNRSKAGEVEEALQEVQLGNMLDSAKKTYTGLASAAAHNLTDAAHGKAAAAMNGTMMVRVTAGAAAAGPRLMTDAGGTPSATVATLSDDGTTVTFEAGVTGFVVEYMARSATAMSAKFAAL